MMTQRRKVSFDKYFGTDKYEMEGYILAWGTRLVPSEIEPNTFVYQTVAHVEVIDKNAKHLNSIIDADPNHMWFIEKEEKQLYREVLFDVKEDRDGIQELIGIFHEWTEVEKSGAMSKCAIIESLTDGKVHVIDPFFMSFTGRMMEPYRLDFKD